MYELLPCRCWRWSSCPESSEWHSSPSKAPNERWEQILVVPSTTETEEKLILTFRIGFRGRWWCKERKKGIVVPFFSPLYSQPKLSSVPWLGGSCVWGGEQFCPQGSLHPSWIFPCCNPAVSELAAVAGRKRRARRKETGWQSLPYWKQEQYFLILDFYSSLKGRTSSNCTWQVLGRKICNRKHEGYDLFS